MAEPQLQIRLRVPMGPKKLEVDFESRHRVVGLFGVSGAGKTTCLEAIAGLRRAARGFIRCGDVVWLDSERGLRMPAEQRRIGYVPQDHLLFPHWSVRRNLCAGRHSEQGTLDADFDEIVDTLGLRELLDRRIEGLSGGERQRVALGRALCAKPRLLMLDEPLAALDLARRKRILPLLHRIRQRFDLPILIVSHSAFELQALCDEVLVLDQGKSTHRGSPAEVFTRPEVYADAAEDSFQNVFRGTVTRHENPLTRLKLGGKSDAPEISIPEFHGQVGQSVTVSLPACEIIIATESPNGLSARNQLHGVIINLEPLPNFLLLRARVPDADIPPLAVELTASACRDLDLHPGKSVVLVFKTNSVAVYA